MRLLSLSLMEALTMSLFLYSVLNSSSGVTRSIWPLLSLPCRRCCNPSKGEALEEEEEIEEVLVVTVVGVWSSPPRFKLITSLRVSFDLMRLLLN